MQLSTMARASLEIVRRLNLTNMQVLKIEVGRPTSSPAWNEPNLQSPLATLGAAAARENPKRCYTITLMGGHSGYERSSIHRKVWEAWASSCTGCGCCRLGHRWDRTPDECDTARRHHASDGTICGGYRETNLLMSLRSERVFMLASDGEGEMNASLGHQTLLSHVACPSTVTKIQPKPITARGLPVE